MFPLVPHGVTTSAERSACAKYWTERNLIMDLAGDEERIQALFYELKRRDLQVVPPFHDVCNSARTNRRDQPNRFNRFFAVITAAVVIILVVSLASWWRKYQSPGADIAQVLLPAAPDTKPLSKGGPASRKIVRPIREVHRLASHKGTQVGHSAIMSEA